MSPVEVVLKLNELVNNRQYDQIDELFSNSYIDHNTSWKVTGVEELKHLMRMGHAVFDLKNEIDDVVASGDWVFVRVKNKGRHRQSFLGIPPTETETCIATFEIYRFEGEKICERWVESDTVGLLAQLGYQLPITIM